MNIILKNKTDLVNNLILLCLCVIIVGLPFSITIIEIAAGIAIGLWLFKKIFILRDFKLEGSPLNWPIAAYLAFVVFSLFNSQFLVKSLNGLIGKTLEYIALYFVIIETVKTKKDLEKIVLSIILSCAFIGLDGLWQYFTGRDFIRVYEIWSMSRVKASFKFPTGFGGWLITVLPLCVALAVFDTKEKFYRLSAAFISLLLLACLVLSLTRGAWLAFIPAVIFITWKKGNLAKKVLLLLLIVLVLGIGALALFGGKEMLELYTVRGQAVAHRAELTEMCLRMIKDRPLIGHGINTFMSIYERYARESSFSGVSYAHNCYLQIAVETGIFSLLAFLWMIASLFISSIRNIEKREDGFIKSVQIGSLAGLLAYLVHSAIETNLFSLQLAVLFYYMLGVTMSIQNIALKQGVGSTRAQEHRSTG